MAQESQELTLFPPEFPEIYFRKTPDEVPNDYMARADEIRCRAREQLALYEQDSNFQYILTHHEKAFENLKPIYLEDRILYPGKSAGFQRYRACVEADDLVAIAFEKMEHLWNERQKASLNTRIDQAVCRTSDSLPKTPEHSHLFR